MYQIIKNISLKSHGNEFVFDIITHQKHSHVICRNCVEGIVWMNGSISSITSCVVFHPLSLIFFTQRPISIPPENVRKP